MSLRFLSTWGPEVQLKRANPLTRERPMSFDLNLSRSVLSRKRPTSSHISAPSKLPIVTSNILLVFFTKAVSLSNRRDRRQCMMMLTSWSVIVAYALAQFKALRSRF